MIGVASSAHRAWSSGIPLTSKDEVMNSHHAESWQGPCGHPPVQGGFATPHPSGAMTHRDVPYSIKVLHCAEKHVNQNINRGRVSRFQLAHPRYFGFPLCIAYLGVVLDQVNDGYSALNVTACDGALGGLPRLG